MESMFSTFLSLLTINHRVYTVLKPAARNYRNIGPHKQLQFSCYDLV